MVPVFVQDEWWGMIGFDDPTIRVATSAHLAAAAYALAAWITGRVVRRRSGG